MIKRPTAPPLTKTERAALYDLITRAARALPTDGDRKRLLRLRELDAADRQQERRVSGGLNEANRQLRQQLKDTTDQLAAVRALHRRAAEHFDSWTCLECGETWPCPTEVALAGP